MSRAAEPHRPGAPDVPEERNPRGHDSQTDPTPIADTVAAGEHATVGRRAPEPTAGSSKSEDAKFIADEFDVPERRAAEVVAGPDASETRIADLAADVHRKRKADDPLAGVPTPEEPESDFTADTDETRLKPVVRRGR